MISALVKCSELEELRRLRVDSWVAVVGVGTGIHRQEGPPVGQ